MGVEGITSVLVSPTKLIIRLPPKSKGVNPAPPALSPMSVDSLVSTTVAEGRKFLPKKFILRIPKSSKPNQEQLNPVPIAAGSPITAQPLPVPVPPNSSKQLQVNPTPAKFNHLDEKIAVEKLRMRYQQEAARKQSRKIQILANLPPPPPSSDSIKSRISSSSANGNAKNAVTIQKGKGSLIMKKARKEFLNCLEVKNLAAMKRTVAAQKKSCIAPALNPIASRSSYRYSASAF